MDLLRFATAGSVDDGKSHADRPAALRLQGDLRGPARGRRADQPGPRRRLHQPRAAHRRPARRARAGHHHRRRLPLLRHAAAQVHHRRHPRPHPVHPQHGDRRLHRRPGDRAGRRPQRAASSRPAGTPSSPRCCGVPHLVLARQQDGPRRLRRRSVFERIRDEFTAFAAKLDIGDLTFIPISALHGDNVVDAVGEHALVRRARRCCTTSSTCTSPSDRNLIDVRFPVQYVIRPHRPPTQLHDYRGYAGPGRRRRAQARRRGDARCRPG